MIRPLLERWRAAPHPVLADRIDLVPCERQSFSSNTAARRWALAAIGHRRPEDLPTILAAAYDSPSTEATARILQALLVHWPDDPRLTSTFRHWLLQPPWVGRVSQRIWLRVHKLLMRTADQRAPALADLPREGMFGTATTAWWAPKMDTLRRRHLTVQEATDDELADWRARLARHAAAEDARRTARATADRMEAAVYEAPDDLSLRAVLADALVELEDPRGEFLQLSLGPTTGAGARRIRALAKDHGASWAGPLDRVLLKSGRVWTRGFLTEGRLRVKNIADGERAAADPRWRLFERLGLYNPNLLFDELRTVLAQADLRHLHTVHGICFGPDLVNVLAMDAPLRRLELATPPLDSPVVLPEPTGPPRHLAEVVLADGWHHVDLSGHLRVDSRP